MCPQPAYASTGTSTSQQYAEQTQVQSQPTQQFEAGQNTVIPLYGESLNVGKREVEAGAVRLRKIVRTETVNQPIELRHEEVVIDREPAGAQTTASANETLNQQFQEGETVIRLQREEPVIEKQVQPTGRIVVQTRMAGQQTNVQVQVRREDIDVAKVGNPENVIISENVRNYASAAGGTAGVGGQTTGSASASTSGERITDVNMLVSTSDPASVAGRPAHLSGLKVQQIFGNGWIAVSSEQAGKPILVHMSDNKENLQPGQVIDCSGRVEQISGSPEQLGLSADATQALSGQSIYIEARKIKVSEK